MIYQSTNYTCGPAAIVNACLVLGVKVTEKKAARLAKTTKKDGTDSAGMVAALKALEVSAMPFDMKHPAAAFAKINEPNPVIICVNGWDHWVTVVGHADTWFKNLNKFIIIDSADTIHNRRSNGVHLMTWSQIEKIWGHGRCKTYSGISVDYLGMRD